MEKTYATDFHHFLHGADYNPEQWIDYPHILEQDIEYMKKANCNVMSVGIFSWAMLEPEEGKYDFGFMDKIIDKLTSNQINVILATPSGAKPRWLAEKYPETLRVNADLSKNIYGFRHNHCYTSPVYREKTAKLDKLLAERYSSNPGVIMWHISNEYGGECHCRLCQSAFRQWLKDKYSNDLKKLNHAWWSGFWSHTVTEWEQIHSPTPLGDDNYVMTGLYVDWKEFITHQTTDFMQCEIKAVKSVSRKLPVTANLMGTYQSIDYYYLSKYLDVVSWDSYPKWHSTIGNELEAYSNAFQHDFHRGLKNGKPFLLMESTPSLTNWLPISKLKKPGMHKLSAMQAVAHGSDSVQYFQWRKGRGGMEKFHGAVVDHNMSFETRVFNDVSEVGKLLKDIDEICGTEVKSQVALVYDFKSQWTLENASGFVNADKKYKRTCINHYKEFWRRGINVDVIAIDTDFSKYKVLLLPMLHSVNESNIRRIEEFVASGGTVIATYATAYVNETDLCYLGGYPGGKLKDVFGISADEIDSLYDGETNSVNFCGKSCEVIDYCEIISTNGAKTLALYEKDFYKNHPAVTVNNYKKGKAYYIACRDDGKLLNLFYEKLIRDLNIKSYDLPNGLSLHTREDENYVYMFVENYSGIKTDFSVPDGYADIISGEHSLSLDEFDVKILKKPK